MSGGSCRAGPHFQIRTLLDEPLHTRLCQNSRTNEGCRPPTWDRAILPEISHRYSSSINGDQLCWRKSHPVAKLPQQELLQQLCRCGLAPFVLLIFGTAFAAAIANHFHRDDGG